MKLLCSLAFLCASSVLAQAPAPGPAPVGPPAVAPAPANPSGAPPLSAVMSMPDSAVFATANGRKMTAGEVKKLVQKIPPQQLAQIDTKELVLQMALMSSFATEAVNQKFDQRSPWKEELENVKNQYLAGAYVNEMRSNGIKVSPEEVAKHYEVNKNRYEQAKIKLIYFAFSDKPASSQADPAARKPMTEPEAKAKAEAVLKELRAGGDFVKAVKDNSDDPVTKAKDGDFGQPLRRTDGIPDNIKTAVFSLKPGQVSDIVRQPNGFYIFRAEEVGLQPLDKVRDQVSQELKDGKFQEWLQKSKSNIQLTFEPAPAAAAAK